MEINPQNQVVPNYALPQYTPCGPWISSYDEYNPWQVVWNQISFAPDPYQQMFNFQENRYGPGLQRRSYSLDPAKTYNLSIQQTKEYAYFTYGGFYDNTIGSFIPIQYIGNTLNGVLGSDIGATAWFDYVRDYPNGLYNNDSKYKLKIKRDIPSGTEITVVMFDGQKTINYHTRIETPSFTIESNTNEDTLLHYYGREIDFSLIFQKIGGSCQLDGYGGAYPVGINFNIDIVQGQEYGNLYYPGTTAEPEQSGTSITNITDEYGIGISNYIIKYKADGIQPDSLTPGIVTIRCGSNDMDIAPVEVSFPVKYNDDPPEEGGIIIVNFNKESFSPGDTAITNCRWLTAYNELLDFPANQSFDVEITGGSEFGMLLDAETGIISGNLQGVSNGFRVMTATSIPYDSVVIRLKVRTSFGIASRGITNQTSGTGIKENNKADIEDDTQTIASVFFIGDPGQEIEGYGDVVVKKGNNWCDSLVSCNDLYYLPNIILNQVPNGYSGFDICTPNVNQLEGVKAFWIDSLYSFDLDICYDAQRQKLWFNIVDNHTLKINYSYAICEDNLPPGQNCQFINDWTEMINTLSCDQYEAILHATYFYGNHAKPCYYFKNIIYAHELEHIKDYQEAIDFARADFYEELNTINISCSNFENINFAKIYLRSILKDKFKELKEKGSYEFIKIQELGAIRSLNQLGIKSYEQDVQNRHSVRRIINGQIDAVNNTYGCRVEYLFE